jgi:hypothetical protein
MGIMTASASNRATVILMVLFIGFLLVFLKNSGRATPLAPTVVTLLYLFHKKKKRRYTAAQSNYSAIPHTKDTKRKHCKADKKKICTYYLTTPPKKCILKAQVRFIPLL